MPQIPMTPRGHERLKQELREAKAERPRLADVILTARELGDLSENADYHAAKERQSFLEGRIRDLESKLAQAQVIDPSRLSGEHVAFGATVTLLDTQSDKEATYTIVGEDEADIKKGLISISSPLAQGVLRRTVGDEVQVKVPGGDRVYEIVDLAFVGLPPEENEGVC